VIDTQAIRSKILDLAMRGQLTEQLPEDGTAEELYQQILEEKQKLIKEGKIKKQKPLPEITDEEIPFDIPKNWKWVRWGTIAKSIQYGYNAPALPSGIIKMVRISDIQKGQVIWDSVPYCEIQNEEISAYLLEPNDILFARTGGTVGKSYLVSVVPEKAIYAGYLVRTQYSNSLCPKYLKYFMESALYWSQLRSGTIATAQPNCNGKTLSKMILPLPSTTEQYRIANKIDQAFSVLDTIDELQAKYADNLTALKSKLIDAAIQGKLTEQLPEDGTADELYQHIQVEKAEIVINRKGRKDNSIHPVINDVPFDIPNNWKWIRFGETGFFRKGPFGSSLTKSMFVPKSENSVKVYEQQHAIKKDHTLGTYYITKEYFDTSMKGFEVLPGDIIVSCAGTIGETYIMPDSIEQGIINQALMRITVVPSIDKRFFLYYFDSQLKRRAKDGNGVAMTNIPPFDVLKNLYFPLPPLSEQKRIVQKLNEILPLCEKV